MRVWHPVLARLEELRNIGIQPHRDGLFRPRHDDLGLRPVEFPLIGILLGLDAGLLLAAQPLPVRLSLTRPADHFLQGDSDHIVVFHH